MRFALAAWMALALAADPPKKDADKKPCELEPYSRKHFPAVKKLLTKHLSEKHAKQMTDLLQKPCEPINQGLVINTCFCLLYTSPSPRDRQKPRMPSSA